EKSSTTRPGPTRRPATKDVGTTPCDLHERDLAAKRSEEVQYATRGFARGVRGGVLTTCRPSLAKIPSKAQVNLASRSRMRNRKEPIRSPRSISRLRACCEVQGPSGRAVTPRICTCRVATSITNSTYRRLRKTVSTWKKSQASRPLALSAQERPPGR